jgi:hypothetical protein
MATDVAVRRDGRDESRFHGAGPLVGARLIPPVSWRGVARRCARGRESVLDLMFVAIVLVFFGLSFGYAAFCDRL